MVSSRISVLLSGEPYTIAPPIGHFHVAKIGHYHVGATAKFSDTPTLVNKGPGISYYILNKVSDCIPGNRIDRDGQTCHQILSRDNTSRAIRSRFHRNLSSGAYPGWLN
jgi:hypothetical protein